MSLRSRCIPGVLMGDRLAQDSRDVEIRDIRDRYAEILIELAPVHSASIDMHQASPGEMPVWTAPDDRKEIGVSGPDDAVATYQDLSAKHALGVPTRPQSVSLAATPLL